MGPIQQGQDLRNLCDDREEPRATSLCDAEACSDTDGRPDVSLPRHYLDRGGTRDAGRRHHPDMDRRSAAEEVGDGGTLHPYTACRRLTGAGESPNGAWVGEAAVQELHRDLHAMDHARRVCLLQRNGANSGDAPSTVGMEGCGVPTCVLRGSVLPIDLGRSSLVGV